MIMQGLLELEDKFYLVVLWIMLWQDVEGEQKLSTQTVLSLEAIS